MRRSYQHILEMCDGVDIQVGWGRSVAKNGHKTIAKRVQPIVAYANQMATPKPAWITVPTRRILPEDFADAAAYQSEARLTFYDEGEEEMKAVEATTVQLLSGQDAVPAGFVHVGWLNAYGSGWEGWPVHP